MDAYTTEEQQVEEIKKWWKENGKSVVAGVVLGLGAIFGWRAWQTEKAIQAEEASNLYQQMALAVSEQNTGGMNQAAEKLNSNYGSTAYNVFAKLLLAKQAVDDKQPAQAEEHLRFALDKNRDDSLEHEIRLRLVRVLIAQEKLTDAQALLEVTNRGAYSASYDELKGDVLRLQGDIEGARAAYEQAQTKFSAAGAQTPILEIKLDDLGRVEL